MSKRGLPANIRMRHDSHYVEELAGQRPTPIGRLIQLDHIDPNPEQPRVEFGDLDELTASIKDRGVLEPLLVTRAMGGGRWMIIAGERRWRAAQAAGLREVPCIEIIDADENAVAEIALIENMQRKDLTPWEEADGLFSLCSRFGYTHDDLAKKIGRSRSSVTEALSIASLPEEIRDECRRAHIDAKSLLIQIARQPDVAMMLDFIKEIGNKGLRREQVRIARKTASQDVREVVKKVKEKNEVSFKYELKDEGVILELHFERGRVEGKDVVPTLKRFLSALERESVGKISESIT